MWFASIRDLQWRRRRFAIGLLGTALVFGVTLLMAALSDSLRHELRTTVAATGADLWVVPAGSSGPFTGLSVVPAGRAEEIAAIPGVEQAAPVLSIHDVITDAAGEQTDIVLFGSPMDGLGAPEPDKGQAPTSSDEVIADRSLGVAIGETVTLGGSDLRVVGLTSGATMEGGIPVVFMDLEKLQSIGLGGAPLAGAILVQGTPTGPLPDDLRALSNEAVIDDLLRRLGKVIVSMNLVKLLLWVVAAAVVGSLVYLTAIERTRDFAVMKATGASTRDLFVGVALQSLLLALPAAVLAFVIAKALIPVFPVPLILTAGPVLFMPVVAVGVGLLASLASLRRVATVDPVVAFS